jgi:hypothetical protein
MPAWRWQAASYWQLASCTFHSRGSVLVVPVNGSTDPSFDALISSVVMHRSSAIGSSIPNHAAVGRCLVVACGVFLCIGLSHNSVHASHYLCSTCIAGCLVLAILPKLSAQHVLPTCRYTYLHRPQDYEVLKASHHLMAAGPNPDTAQAMAANDHPASNTSSGSPRADECPMAQQCSAAAVAAAGAGHTEHLNTEVTGPATPTHSSLASPVLSPLSSPDASRRSSVAGKADTCVLSEPRNLHAESTAAAVELATAELTCKVSAAQLPSPAAAVAAAQAVGGEVIQEAPTRSVTAHAAAQDATTTAAAGHETGACLFGALEVPKSDREAASASAAAARRNVEMLFANVDAEQQLQVGTLSSTMVGSTPLAGDTSLCEVVFR